MSNKINDPTAYGPFLPEVGSDVLRPLQEVDQEIGRLTHRLRALKRQRYAAAAEMTTYLAQRWSRKEIAEARRRARAVRAGTRAEECLACQTPVPYCPICDFLTPWGKANT